MAAEGAIVTRRLTKTYNGFTAVDHLDFEVSRGEIFGLLGPNGAGKTTTILMLLGLSEPSSGEATVLGRDPTREPLEVKRRVGYLPENVGFYHGLTGRLNLAYTAALNGIGSGEAEQRIDEALSQVGLTHAADAKAGTYSRGMRQRLGIADALVKRPEILILDEPTIGIDPEGVRDLLHLVRALPGEQGVTVLLSSHLLYQVQSICDRVGIFFKGRLVVQGPVPELAARWESEEVLLEIATTDWAAAGDALRSIAGIRSIERDANFWVVRGERDVRGDVGRVFAERGIPLLHLRRRGEALDEIYSRYFEEAEGARS